MGTLSGILRVCFPQPRYYAMWRHCAHQSAAWQRMRWWETKAAKSRRSAAGLDAFKLKHDSRATYTAPCQHLVTSLENIWALCLQKYAHNLFLKAIKFQECWQVQAETREAMINIVSYKNWEATLKIINIARWDEMSEADAMNHPSLA